MKKITSAALLAIQLSWKTVLAMFLASVVLQIFYACRELMPGGVPLQATLGYEMLLSGDIGRTGRHWLSMLLTLLIAGVVIDLLVWLIRWRPYWVWFRKKRIVIEVIMRFF